MRERKSEWHPQAESELRRTFFQSLRAAGVCRSEAKEAAAKAAKQAVKIVRRFGPRSVTLMAFEHEHGRTFGLVYPTGDLDGTQRDISETMSQEAKKHVMFGAL